MAFTSIPNGVRIAHIGSIGGHQVVNTVGCQNGGTEVGDDLGVIAKKHGDAWRAQMVPIMSAAYTHVNTLAYSLEDQSAMVGDAAYGSGLVGGAAGGPAPAHACVVVSLKTAKRGRTYQGRMFLSPFLASQVDMDASHWVAALTASINTKFAAYKAAVDPATGDNGRLAVCSEGSVSKGIAPHVEPVTAFVVRSVIGSQRRRLQ